MSTPWKIFFEHSRGGHDQVMDNDIKQKPSEPRPLNVNASEFVPTFKFNVDAKEFVPFYFCD